MVVFDQLRISDDGKRMYISVHVNRADYFKDVYLESITVTTADNVLETVESLPDKYIYQQKFETTVPTETDEDNRKKEVDLVIDIGILCGAFINKDSNGNAQHEYKPFATIDFQEKRSNFSNDLFFVYVKTTGGVEYSPCLPCRFDEEITVGVTFDEGLLYQRMMNFTRELADDCIIPQGFTDFILLWNAFKVAIETEHYKPAIEYFNMLFGNKATGYGSSGTYGKSKGCGCHG